MTTYNEYETSPASSAPIEGYKFIGTFKTYRYTSADKSVIINGEVYLPIAIKRGNAKAGTQEDDNLMLDLTLPFDVDVVLAYAYSQVPPKLDLEVYRAQVDDATGNAVSLFWKGKCRGFKVQGRTATVSVPSIFSLALQGDVPNVWYQASCNHVLYDDMCQVPRVGNNFPCTVAAFTSSQVGMTEGLTTDNDLAAGELVNTRTGERRLIVGNTGSVVLIGYPFVDVREGDAMVAYRGCDHAILGGCTKFNNIINFGGFPYIPPENPFTGSL